MSKQYPKITVVTPNYNQEKFIELTIQSVLSQNYPNLEYIIIDGGSSDGSVDIIKKYADQLSYWVSEPDKGMYDAIQKGFSRSSGEIMTYINSDDLLQPHSLFTVASIFSKYTQVQWLSGNPNCITEYGQIFYIGSRINWTKFHYLTGNYQFIQQEGTFWSRELWNKAGATMSVNLSLAGDMELWSRFFHHAEFFTISAILGSFRYRSANQKTLEQFDKYHLEAQQVLKNYLPSTAKEIKIVKKYKGIGWRIVKRLKFIRFMFWFGYADLYKIFIKTKDYFYFDRITQEYSLMEEGK